MAALRLTLATFFSGAYQQAVAHHVSGKYDGWAAAQESPRSVGMLADYDDRFSAAGNCGDDCFWLQADIQPPEIDFRLYEALAVKVVLVCVA